MIIQLNVLQDGSCARIFAFKEPKEATWWGLSSIKIWHNQGKESIERHFKAPVWHENDYIIEFKSKISFQEFCDLFCESEYNDGDQYNFYTHNCANAAKYALKLVGIDLDIGKLKQTRICPHPITRIPTPFLAPVDLFYHAKAYYEKTERQLFTSLKKINRIPHSNAFKFELANKALLFWGSKQKDKKLKETTFDLEKALVLHQQKHPHRTTLYRTKAIELIDLLLDPAPSVSRETNRNSHFKDRQTFNMTRAIDINLNLYLLFQMYCLLLNPLLLLCHLSSTTSTDEANEEEWRASLLINCLTGASVALLVQVAMLKYKHYAFEKDKKHGHQLTKDTPLSKAIEAFENAVLENKDSQKQGDGHSKLKDLFISAIREEKDDATFSIRL